MLEWKLGPQLLESASHEAGDAFVHASDPKVASTMLLKVVRLPSSYETPLRRLLKITLACLFILLVPNAIEATLEPYESAVRSLRDLLTYRKSY